MVVVVAEPVELSLEIIDRGDSVLATQVQLEGLMEAFDAPMFVKRPVERVRARFGGGLWVGDSGGSRGRCSASRNG